jgi:ParB/RepB/Spo0J family partition protein
MSNRAIAQPSDTPATGESTAIATTQQPDQPQWELTTDAPRGREEWRRHDDVIPSKTNPRKRFDEDKLKELAENIQRHGILQSVLCRAHPDFPEKLEIIAGERRWRAAGIAKLALIPVRVIEVNDLDMLELQIIENLQRQDLHELEEAESYESLINANKGNSNYGVDEIAAKVGKSRAYVYARMKLCALSEDSREAFYSGKLNASTALLLARLPNETMQATALEVIARPNWSGEVMSFRAAADYIKRTFMLRLDQARFPITDVTLVPSAGSCRECPKRTGANPDLFSDVGSADVCTDPACHEEKVVAHAERLRRIAAESGKTIIDGEAAKKAMPHGVDSTLNGYIKLDDRCQAAPDRPLADNDQDAIEDARDDHEYEADDGEDAADTFVPPAEVKPRYREILPENVLDQAVVLIDPRTGVAIEAVPAGAANEALGELGIKDWNSSDSRSSADTRAENKARREKQRLEIDYRKRLVARIRDALAAGEPADDQNGAIRREHTNILAASLFDRSHPHTKRALCQTYSWDVAKHGTLDLAAARKRFADLDHGTIGEALLLLVILPALDIDEYRNPSSVELVDIAASLGINSSAVKKEAAAAARATKAPAKKAGKASDTKPTSGKRTPKQRGKANEKPPAPEPQSDSTGSPALAADHLPVVSTAPPQPDGDATPPDAPMAGIFMREGMRVKVREDAVNAAARPMHQRGWAGSIELIDGAEAKVKWDNGKKAGKLPMAMFEVILGPDKASAAESLEGTESNDTASGQSTEFASGDRVKVKDDAKSPQGRRMKVCGRKGTILKYATGTAQIQFDDGSSHMNVPGQAIERLDPAADADSTEEAA